MADHSAVEAAISEAIVDAGGLPEGVRVERTNAHQGYGSRSEGPDRVTVRRYDGKTKHFQPLKTGGYNVERIAAEIRAAGAEVAGAASARGMIREALALLGGWSDYDLGVTISTTEDYRVNVAFRLRPRLPENWSYPSATSASVKMQRVCATVDEIVAAVREAQAIREEAGQ